MNRTFYAIHKWISAAAFVQLTIWSVTGLLFAMTPEETIRGEVVENAHHATLDAAPPVEVSRAMEAASAEVGAVSSIELRGTVGGPFYVAHGERGAVRVDARSGAVAPVLQSEAEATARRDHLEIQPFARRRASRSTRLSNTARAPASARRGARSRRGGSRSPMPRGRSSTSTRRPARSPRAATKRGGRTTSYGRSTSWITKFARITIIG